MAVNLIARFESVAGKRDEVAALIGEYAKHVRGSAGTVVFEVYTEQEDPNQFVVVERYSDQAAFEAHLADPENAVFNSKLVPLIASDGSELTFLDPVA